MKKYYLILFFLPLIFFSQKKKEIVILGSLDAKVLAMNSFGNNFYSKILNPFVGFGFGLNFLTNLQNFGVSFNYYFLKASQKIGQTNIYGSLSDPQMNLSEINLFHQDKLDEDFLVEEFAGVSIYRVNSDYIYLAKKYSQGNTGFNGGVNLVYVLDPDGKQQAYVGAKINVYNARIINENPDIQQFFSRAYFGSLILGYRYNF
jgi:hypothetical protein